MFKTCRAATQKAKHETGLTQANRSVLIQTDVNRHKAAVTNSSNYLVPCKRTAFTPADV